MSKVCYDATLIQRQQRMNRDFDAKREDVEARIRRRELTLFDGMKILHQLRASQHAALRRRSA